MPCGAWSRWTRPRNWRRPPPTAHGSRWPGPRGRARPGTRAAGSPPHRSGPAGQRSRSGSARGDRLPARARRTGRDRAERSGLAGPGRSRGGPQGGRPTQAVPALAKALAEPNADVRKAAVLSLLAHRTHHDAQSALATATRDPDADVRACAARAAG
ncbi:HEAT repeat domain-containing protein [Streptomyces violascens]|uniref:HEAT repeat domain-containing protein n=1 Tax=Streptomyces violascens TaxID=67381 RepID=UPI0036861225